MAWEDIGSLSSEFSGKIGVLLTVACIYMHIDLVMVVLSLFVFAEFRLIGLWVSANLNGDRCV